MRFERRWRVSEAKNYRESVSDVRNCRKMCQEPQVVSCIKGKCKFSCKKSIKSKKGD